MKRVAFVGVGAMGEPMAANLVRKGFHVTVVRHVRPDPVTRLSALGAAVAGSCAEAASDCDAAIIMLPSSSEVERVVAGPDGLLQAMRPGTVVVDCSTSDPASSRELARLLAARDVAFVDAPVTRGVQGAQQGRLAYFVGGDEHAVRQVMPILEAMGETFHLMGRVGNGHTLKLLSNALSYATVALVSEALSAGLAAQLPSDALYAGLMSGAPSKALEVFGLRMLQRQYEPSRVSVQDAYRHLQTAERAVNAAGSAMPLTIASIDAFSQALAKGLGRKDIAAIADATPRPTS